MLQRIPLSADGKLATSNKFQSNALLSQASWRTYMVKTSWHCLAATHLLLGVALRRVPCPCRRASQRRQAEYILDFSGKARRCMLLRAPVHLGRARDVA
jgi:hypothetical protein